MNNLVLQFQLGQNQDHIITVNIFNGYFNIEN